MVAEREKSCNFKAGKGGCAFSRFMYSPVREGTINSQPIPLKNYDY